MSRLILMVVPILFAAATSMSQELWLRPDKYFYEPGERAEIQFQSGENFMGEPVTLEKDQVTVLELWNRLGSTDIQTSYNVNEDASFGVQIPQQGYHFIILKTDRSYSLNRQTFEEYVKQYGLEEQVDELVSESAGEVLLNLTHRVQLSLRSGKQGGNGWNKSLSLPIEIIPDKNPQVLRRGDRIHFQVLEKGEPAFGVRVKIWNRWDNRTTIQNIYTEKDGMISTTISNPGDWMVTVVKLHEDATPDAYAGDSFSLLFGYR